ncbi:lipoprotein-releasing system permease protein [Pseudarcicella hirudinis]|uniref:Lipoprotein-releasing system permease protein n=1 Tax=Pseudarcicella hirudinis TaxID=1079859 RepID=A0A1I5WEU0_9BACT|nr:FtsX-like permease family protein [Pseudarcicella hirudinis]SFQ18117.1 lipoprotein-releasing system permease protein [Pseudarcicella hirudinis]
MNFAYFISRRIQDTKNESFSATVTRIGVGSIALGLAVMIIAFAVLFGFKGAIRQKVFSLSSHIKVSKFTANSSYEENPITKQSDLYRHYRNIPEIAHIQTVAQKAGLLKTKEDLSGVVLKGIGKDFDTKMFAPNMVAGEMIAFPDSGYSRDILVSRQIAGKLRLKPGDNAIIYFLNNPERPRKLTIKGIYETGLEEFDKNLIIGDISLIQRINNWGVDSVGSYEIFVKDFSKLNLAVEKVQNKIQPDMRLIPVTKMYQGMFDWLDMLDRNMLIFLILISFVASFNMISILLVLMMERTPMIGLLKALGSPDWQIRKVFIFNGISMIIKGLLYGNLIGIGVCYLQQYFHIIPLDPASYYMNTVPISMDWLVIILLNVSTLALVSFVLLIPTLVITRIQPVRAIAFKS